jgi:hypothetical protein
VQKFAEHENLSQQSSPWESTSSLVPLGRDNSVPLAPEVRCSRVDAHIRGYRAKQRSGLRHLQGLACKRLTEVWTLRKAVENAASV